MCHPLSHMISEQDNGWCVSLSEVDQLCWDTSRYSYFASFCDIYLYSKSQLSKIWPMEGGSWIGLKLIHMPHVACTGQALCAGPGTWDACGIHHAWSGTCTACNVCSRTNAARSIHSGQSEIFCMLHDGSSAARSTKSTAGSIEINCSSQFGTVPHVVPILARPGCVVPTPSHPGQALCVAQVLDQPEPAPHARVSAVGTISSRQRGLQGWICDTHLARGTRWAGHLSESCFPVICLFYWLFHVNCPYRNSVELMEILSWGSIQCINHRFSYPFFIFQILTPPSIFLLCEHCIITLLSLLYISLTTYVWINTAEWDQCVFISLAMLVPVRLTNLL